MDNPTEKERADAFLKEIDEVSAKHNLYLGISNPQFIVQPRHAPSSVETPKLDIESLPLDQLQEMVDKYAGVVEKAQLNVALIQAEIVKRKATQN